MAPRINAGGIVVCLCGFGTHERQHVEGVPMMECSDVVKLEFEERVAIVTLNRPEKLNAINLELKQALDKVLDEIKS